MQATVLILDISDDSGQVFLVCVCVCVDMIKTAAAIITNERIADRRSCFSEVFAGLEKEGKERKQETTGKKKTLTAARV